MHSWPSRGPHAPAALVLAAARSAVFDPGLDAAIRNTRDVVAFMCFTRGSAHATARATASGEHTLVTRDIAVEHSFYDPFSQRVFLTRLRGHQNDAIAHELGHHIDQTFSGDDRVLDREVREVGEAIGDARRPSVGVSTTAAARWDAEMARRYYTSPLASKPGAPLSRVPSFAPRGKLIGRGMDPAPSTRLGPARERGTVVRSGVTSGARQKATVILTGFRPPDLVEAALSARGVVLAASVLGRVRHVAEVGIQGATADVGTPRRVLAPPLTPAREPTGLGLFGRARRGAALLLLAHDDDLRLGSRFYTRKGAVAARPDSGPRQQQNFIQAWARRSVMARKRSDIPAARTSSTSPTTRSAGQPDRSSSSGFPLVWPS